MKTADPLDDYIDSLELAVQTRLGRMPLRLAPASRDLADGAPEGSSRAGRGDTRFIARSTRADPNQQRKARS